MTAAIKNDTSMKKVLSYMKRMHWFHPGRFYSIVIGMGFLTAATVSALIALPMILH